MRYQLALACCCLPFAAWSQEGEVVVPESQCTIALPVPLMVDPNAPAVDSSTAPVNVQADTSRAIAGESAIFKGKVKLTQGNRAVTADTAEVQQLQQRVTAQGDLVFQDPQLTITADSLEADTANSQATLTNSKYWLHGQQVHGDAEQLELTPDNDIILSKGTFTTCPGEEPDWELKADKIIIDSEEEWGKIYDAQVRVFNTPVFYLPYMTVPVSDKRKTGFLFPAFSTSTKNGVDLKAPFYWNIAPNYDLTLTPQMMSARGVWLAAEGRYLHETNAGQLNLEYINNDRLDSLLKNDNRYAYAWQHTSYLESGWRLHVNYSDISDDNYFNDFDSAISASTDNQLSRFGEASYFQDNWNVAVKVQDIKVLGDAQDPFRVMPQVNYQYHLPSFYGAADFQFDTELTHFSHEDSNELKATRWHMEPTLTLPYQTPAGGLTAELKLMQTLYQQDIPTNNPNYDQLDSFVSRTLPQVRLHGQINFERETSFWSNSYRQTLEPQIQYLYVPYDDQDDIGVYDTALLQDDYDGLFRDRRFSGLDRIADANQFTLGVATRYFDSRNEELLRLSVGQIFYLADSDVTLPNQSNQIQQSSSAMAAELDMKIQDDWFFTGSLQFDTDGGNTNKSEVSVDYRPGRDKLLQLSHRYVPELAINETTGEVTDINQFGFRTTWPVAKDTYFVGNYYYDGNLSRTIETFAGIQWESCCWAVRLTYDRHLNTNYNDSGFTDIGQRDSYDTSWSLTFELKGLGSSGPLGVSDMQNEGLFNYRQPYYLRN
ncbi:LPS assembly protein LptD [Ferrimonas aestuarii]|uniref:LPS-assembly protein LptD n=2 Tax=Ferrimonas aestuarii TaxID=2569539 RepID=A0A4U1BHZ1_9GAMM|nr:LPS assembly protein LptD [Ferrimonas aestuarii]TKB50917.1 LPS assembly protein LptD [Ferrimonas aestuarii]